jgi:hypothetical protein
VESTLLEIVANSALPFPVPAVSLVGDPLARSVLGALAYADLFDYPLSLDEMTRYQIATSYSREELAHALTNSPHLKHAICSQEQYYCLRGRESVFEARHLRAAPSARAWRRATIYSRILARLPFVRMVAVTGALAMDNISVRPDIDLLVVTRQGRVWIGRRFIIGLVRVARLFGDELCPNYVISRRSLRLEQQDLFTAHELAQMVPMYGQALYEEMLERNSWARHYLPRAFCSTRKHVAALPRGFVRRLVEMPLSASRLDRWERWEMARLQRKLRPLVGDAAEVICSPQQCKGHTGLHRQRVTTRYAERLRELGI